MFNQIKKLCSISSLLVLVFLCFSSCRSKRTVVSEPVIERQVIRDTVRVERLLRDSVYLKDSIRIETQNDTVYTDRWHTQYVERVKYLDSISVRRDTIPVEVTITKTETVAYTPKHVKALAFLGVFALLCLVGYLLGKTKIW